MARTKTAPKVLTQSKLGTRHLGWGILAVLPFLPALLAGRAFLFRDLTNIQLPYKATWLAAVSELGRIPHWDPLHVGGFRFVADLNYGPLYPLNWLLFFFRADLPLGLSVFILVHHVLIYCGWFLYLRDLRVRLPLAVAGALSISWLGATVSSQNILHHICGQAAVGFFLFFWNRSLRRPGARWEIFAASAALAWPVYGGDPQYSYLMGIIGAWMWAWARAPWRDKGWKLPALVALLVLVAAPQLFPTWDYLKSTGRMLDAQSVDEKLAHSLHPVRLFGLVFQWMFGYRPGEFRAENYLNGGSTPFLLSIYAGAIAFGAAIQFPLRRIPLRKRRGKREWKRAGELAGFILLVLATMGAFSPVPIYQLAMQVVPLWETFRYPERLGYWVSALLLLYGLLSASKFIRRRAMVSRKPEKRDRRYEWGLCGLLVADMFLSACLLTWTQPKSLTQPQSYAWAEKILADKEKNADAIEKGGAFRFFSGLEARLDPPEPFSLSLLDETDTSVYSAWAGMKFNTPGYWGLALVRGHGSLVPSPPVLKLTHMSQPLAMRVLDLYSTRWLLMLENGTPRAVVNQNALPWVSFPAMGEYLPSEEAMLERLQAPGWDPRKSVLLERKLAMEASNKAPIEVLRVERGWDEFTIRGKVAAASPPRWMLVNERHDPAWAVRVNGKEVPFVRANGWALGVEMPFLEAGEFTVEMKYFDRAFYLGKLAFCAWLVALTAFLVLRKEKRA